MFIVMNSVPQPPADPVLADDFYSRAFDRLPRFMIFLGIVTALGSLALYGRYPALGVVLGSLIALLNFRWLKSGVSALADRVTNTEKSQSGKGIVVRFLVRYFLMGAAAYGILTSFPASLRGFFVGLFLPVGAIACETGYELYGAFARKD
jgi:hypothetical protein